MSLKIFGYKDDLKSKFYLACPQCDKPIETNMLQFILAINQELKWFCVDCGCGFRVEIVRLNRAAELRNEAESGGTTEACPATRHDFLREKAVHKYCYVCGERLLS